MIAYRLIADANVTPIIYIIGIIAISFKLI